MHRGLMLLLAFVTLGILAIAIRPSIPAAESTSDHPATAADIMQSVFRDREDHALETVVVEVEHWDGKSWAPGKPTTWRRSTKGLPCADRGASDAEP